jgi:general secretion pathway protein A
MYTAFYGLREKPFSLSPDPRFLFFADSHREALAHLRYGLTQGEGFMAITGEVGTGKTTICRTLLQRLGPDTEVAFLFNPARSATELLQSIAHEFGLEPAGRQRHALNEQLNRFLLDKKREGQRVLLIIDEAQNLDDDVLEEVRLLSNLETESSKLIQIILLGQPELGEKLDSEGLRQLRQRISVRWNLAPLGADETSAYVRHRLKVAAGAERESFSAGALREIYRSTGGVPRRINLLCDRVLLAGYASGQHRIGRGLVKKAAREIAQPGLGRDARSSNSLSRTSMVGIAASVFALAVVVGINVGDGDGLESILAQAGNRLRSVSSGLIGLESTPEPSEVVATIDAEAVLAAVSATAELESIEGRGQFVTFEESNEPGEAAIGVAARESGDFEEFAMLEVVGREPELIDTLASTSLAKPRKPVGTRSERVYNTLAPGSFLGRLLDHQEPGRARFLATNSILESYRLASYRDEPESIEESLVWLEQRGLSALEIVDGDIEALRVLNHPTLLVLRSEVGAQRLVSLAVLGSEHGVLFGVEDSGGLETRLSEIESQWNGEAYVIWEAFEAIPDVLMLGQSGRGVVWLQEGLGELGYYEGEVTGLFDRATEAGVTALQNSRDIEADGAVGPRTQMILYDMLDRYRLPRLVGEAQLDEGLEEIEGDSAG